MRRSGCTLACLALLGAVAGAAHAPGGGGGGRVLKFDLLRGPPRAAARALAGAAPREGGRSLKQVRWRDALRLVSRGERWRDPLAFMSALQREHGSHVFLRMPSGNVLLFVSDPAVVEAVLADTDRAEARFEKSAVVGDAMAPYAGRLGMFTGKGPRWKRQRQALASSFTPKALSHGRMALDMSRVVAERVRALKARAEADGQAIELDLSTELADLTLEVLLETLFHTRAIGPPERAKMTSAIATMMGVMTLEVANPTRVGLHLAPVTRSLSALRAARKTLREAADALIRERRAAGPQTPHDVLDVMIETAADPRELPDQVLSMILAGHETTSTALAWTLLELDARPDLVGRLRDPDRAPLLAATFQEGMRLHAPVYVLARRARVTTSVPTADGGTLEVPAGTQVVMPLYLQQRDEALWGVAATGYPAKEFHPERWAGLKGRAGAPRMSPFGRGPRVCLGQHFALAEGHLILAAFLDAFDVKRQRPREADAHADLSARIAGGFRVRMSPRVSAGP